MAGRKRWIYGIALGIALMMTSLFTVRAMHHASALRRGGDEPLRPWMNVPYIARSYQVPPDILWEALGVDQPRPHLPIARIAREQHRPLGAVIADIQEAVVAYRAGTMPMPPLPSLPTSPILPELPAPPEDGS
jgi:hypothetical protein